LNKNQVVFITGAASGIGYKIGVEFAKEGAKVSFKVEKQGKDKKIIVYKYKAKKNYRRKKGHRQPFTKVVVEKIEVNGKGTPLSLSKGDE